MKQRILCVLVNNESGVLLRVTSLISRRGFNIDSLAVGETADKSVSRMTIFVTCDDAALDQMKQQLCKLVCVRRLTVLEAEQALSRELILMKIATDSQTRGEVLEIANIFRARVLDVSHDSLTLEITGEGGKTNALIAMMEQYGILEIARTGAASLIRGKGTIYEEGDDNA